MEHYPELAIRVQQFRNKGKVMSKKGKNAKAFQVRNTVQNNPRASHGY